VVRNRISDQTATANAAYAELAAQEGNVTKLLFLTKIGAQALLDAYDLLELDSVGRIALRSIILGKMT
jgi:hypothetical protein